MGRPKGPFTNFTFDVVPPSHIAKEAIIIGGQLQDSTYGEYAEEMAMINRAFLEVMIEGDADGRIFSFPIPTYNVTEDFPWDSEVGKLLLTMTAKYGAPYFQNFINSDLNPEDVRSMCCRLQMDLREIRKKTGGLFGAGDLTGSIGVVTLNLPKLAYLAHNEEDFLDLVAEYAHLASESLEFKRKVVEKNLDAGMFPFSRRYLKNGFKRPFLHYRSHRWSRGMHQSSRQGCGHPVRLTPHAAGPQPSAPSGREIPGRYRQPVQPGSNAR